MSAVRRVFQKVAVVLLFACVAIGALAGPATLKTYSLGEMNPAEMADLIRAMVPDDDGMLVQPSGSKLLVRATAEQHRLVAEMVRDLCALPLNVQINVQFERSGSARNRGIGVRPRGPLVLHDGKVAGRLKGTLRDQSDVFNESRNQMLVAASGKAASLRVSEKVPHLLWIEQYHHSHYGHHVQAHVEWQEVGAFLAIEPTLVGTGPMIRIRVIPRLSGRLKNGGRRSIEFTELATEITGQDGVPIALGGLDEHKDFYSRFLVGGTGRNQTAITKITLTPKILR